MLRADTDTDDQVNAGQSLPRDSTPRWQQFGPPAVVALVVAYNLWILRGERVPVQSGNDSEIHRNMLQWAVHRIENPGTEPVQIIEVQSGGYLGEDDIVRLDDTYGRKGRTD